MNRMTIGLTLMSNCVCFTFSWEQLSRHPFYHSQSRLLSRSSAKLEYLAFP
jgi:hypothetical protein